MIVLDFHFLKQFAKPLFSITVKLQKELQMLLSMNIPIKREIFADFDQKPNDKFCQKP